MTIVDTVALSAAALQSDRNPLWGRHPKPCTQAGIGGFFKAQERSLV
jgi:hypothetical protein